MAARIPTPAPQALHLARLAQGTPGQWVRMPGGELRVIHLDGKLSGDAVNGWLVCLMGEAVIDLPLNNYVRLRPSEGYRVTVDEAWTAFETKPATVLMLVAENASG